MKGIASHLGSLWLDNLPFSRFSIALASLEKRNIDDERAALIEALEKFHQYLVDAPKDDSEEVKPHLGELTIYGVLRGLDGLAVFDTVMGTYPDTIKPWYETMAEVVETK